MRQLKSKRWYRRNRHINPNLVSAYRECEFCFRYYNEYYFPVRTNDKEIYHNGFRSMCFEDFAWIKQCKEQGIFVRDESKP